MGIGAGLTSAILNPLHSEEMMAVRGANVMVGMDPECRKWIEEFRDPEVNHESRSTRSGRQRRRKTK